MEGKKGWREGGMEGWREEGIKQNQRPSRFQLPSFRLIKPKLGTLDQVCCMNLVVVQ